MLRNKKGQYRTSYLDRFYGLILLVETVALGLVLHRIGEPAQVPISPKVPPMVIKQVFASETITEPPSTSLTVDQIVDGIWMLESSRGTTGKPGSLQHYCESRHLSNSYGYGGMKLKMCFNSHEEAQARVITWVNKYYEKFDGNLGKVACYYNLGLAQDDCPYYQNLLKVINEN